MYAQHRVLTRLAHAQNLFACAPSMLRNKLGLLTLQRWVPAVQEQIGGSRPHRHATSAPACS